MSDADYDHILRPAFSAAVATGPLVLSPVPGPDQLAMAGIWGSMMTAVARRTGHGLDAATARKFVLAVSTSVGAYWTASKWITWVFAKVPGVGWATGTAVNSTLNSMFTLWLGLSFVDLFERDDIDLTDLEDCLTFVRQSMRISPRSRMITRIREFFSRWNQGSAARSA